MSAVISGSVALPKALVPPAAKPRKIAVPAMLAALLVASLIGGGVYYRSRHQNNRLTDKDTVVIADFAMAGVDIRTAAELSGHKTLAVTMRFAHLAADHQRAAVEQLEATTAAEQPPGPC